VFHHKDIFGLDADMYRPERWLDADEERLKAMDTTLDLTFQPGRWQCLGKGIALIELNKVFAEVGNLSPVSLWPLSQGYGCGARIAWEWEG
jgi:hypothetical protein